MRITHAARGALAVVMAATTILGTAGAASAGAPMARLRQRDRVLDREAPYTYCWSGDGVGECGDGFPRYGRAKKVVVDRRIRIRFGYRRKPERLRITAYPRLDEDGNTDGRPRRLDRRLRPVYRDGEIRAWDAVFRVHRERHFYLDVAGFWDRGDAFYAFHLKGVAAP
jgi:hypothetical protein